jgi:hypothetical protein
MTTGGRRVTALDIQRHYLSCVQEYLGGSRLPDWAERLCILWKRILNELEAGRSHVAGTLDWAIKHKLFEHWLGRQGFTFRSLSAWNTAIHHLEQTWKWDGPKDQPLDLRQVRPGDQVLDTAIARLTPFLAKRGLTWQQFHEFARVRSELFELDSRFGDLGEQGLFHALDRAGTLTHRMESLDFAGAIAHPPQDTRARLRGEVVQRLTRAGTRYSAEWTGIYDIGHRRQLDLRNPFETEERWTDVASASLATRLADVFGHYGS